FSKTLSPGMRVGWVVADPATIQSFVQCGTTQMGGGSNPFTANIIAEYCRKGYLEPHVASLRAIYKARCEAALSALSLNMPARVAWTHPTGGFFLWLTLPENVVAQQVKQVARERGVLIA